MKKKTILLISLTLSLFLTGLFLADETMASDPTLRITIAPRTGSPGTAISVTGEGAQTDKLVRVALVTSGEGGISLAEVEVTPQADGTFVTTIIVPDGTGNGTYAVRAEQINPVTGGLIHYWYNNFTVAGAAAPAPPEATTPVAPTTVPSTVEPTITVPATAAPGATATITSAPPGQMPTTGTRESSKPDYKMVMIIAILAALGVLAAFGAGLRQARKT